MEEINKNQDHEKELADLYNNVRSSAKWFYWIAGLSLINTMIVFFGGGVSFIVGLGITQIIDGIVIETASTVKFIALFINILVSGMFAIFGYFALKHEKWAFIIGMVLYLLDGLIFLLVNDWWSVGFHAFVLLSLFAGIKSLRKIEALQILEDGGVSRIEKEIAKY